MPAPPKKDDKKGKKKGKEEEIKIPKELIEQFLPEQYELSTKIFGVMDKKQEGIVDVKEIGYMLRLIGGNPTEAEVTEWMDAAKNENGKMNILAWIQVAALELRTRKTDADITIAFETFDHDTSGTVKADEIRRQLVSNAEAFPENVADEFLTEAMPVMDENGRLNYREFIQHMGVVTEKAWLKKKKKLGLAPPTEKGKKGKKKKK